jgi:FdhD protein
LRFDRAGNAIDDHANRMPRRPFLSNATIALTETIEALDERGRRSTVSIPAERPLTIYLDKRELVTLMTLGGAPEALALGYLRNQRFVRSIDDIAAVQVDWEVDAAAVTTRGRVDDIDERGAESAAPGEGRGATFAALMEEVEAISLSRTARLRQSTLYGIIDAVRAQRSVYKQAGSLHACALFSVQGEMLYFMEDVGRHNAVDAIAGRMWLDDVSGDDKVFYTTGRLTSEMVIKGGQMGIPFLLSRSGTTRMGHAVAQRLGISMFARCSGTHFLLLSGRERLILDLQLPDALAE